VAKGINDTKNDRKISKYNQSSFLTFPCHPTPTPPPPPRKKLDDCLKKLKDALLLTDAGIGLGDKKKVRWSSLGGLGDAREKKERKRHHRPISDFTRSQKKLSILINLPV
jgi:hypothetical protein